MNKRAAEYFKQKFLNTMSAVPSLDGAIVNWMDEGEDDSKYRAKTYNFENGKPTLAASLYGFKRGIACIAGLPNHGKSTLIVNMILGGLANDPDLMVVDVSLDDDPEKRIQQYIACLTGLDYQEIASKNLPPNKAKRIEEAKQVILSYFEKDRLRMHSDEEEVTDPETGEIKRYSLRNFRTLFNTMKEVREEYPNRKIYFFVDAWNDFKFETESNSETKYANDRLADLKQLCKKYNIGIFLNCHLRKTQGRRPTIEDIKGTSDMYYAAVWACIVWNEFRENPSKDPVMYSEGNFKYPMIAVQIKKNKSSDWDYDLYYGLIANACQLRPLEKTEFKNTRTLFAGRKDK